MPGLGWIAWRTPITLGGGTDTLERELEELLNREQVEEGDHERFSHYAPKNKIMESALTGKPVRALCGKMWVPGPRPGEVPDLPDLQGDLREAEGLGPSVRYA